MRFLEFDFDFIDEFFISFCGIIRGELFLVKNFSCNLLGASRVG